MNEREEHIRHLFEAELQFRLTAAVRIAVTSKRQPLDLPIRWTHGQEEVRYDEVALRQDQAEYAALLLQRSATYMMAVSVKEAIEAIAPGLSKSAKNDRSVRQVINAATQKPWKVTDDDVVAAYHIASLIRNALAHGPFAPKWDIRADLQERELAISDIIELKTKGLNKTPVDWKSYGGLLSLFRLCRFARTEILGDHSGRRQAVPTPERTILQCGDMILEETAIPPGAVRIEPRRNPDGSIDLGGGYALRVNKKKTS
jgi:hypothetical protein